jgi:alkylation response protein AidB-like acyl-CoA dehydrogenase
VTRTLFEPEHETFRESFARFLAEEVVPVYSQWAGTGVPAEVFAAAAEHGFVAMAVPEAHGGAEVQDVRFGVVLVEEAMRAGVPALAVALGAHNDVCVPLLVRHASAGQRARWFPALAAGTLLAALAPYAIESPTATPFVVGGARAGLLLAVARPTMFAVPADRPGVSRERSEPLIGLEALDLADVRFDGVALGEDDRLGAAGAGEALLLEAAIDQRLTLAVASVAGARAALSLTLDYVRERRAFGQPIARFENTRYALAAVAAELETVQALVDACVCERASARLTAERAAVAKLAASELYGRAVDAGVQLHGGYGYMTEYPIARAFADARPLRLLGGTSEQLEEVIAGSIGL